MIKRLSYQDRLRLKKIIDEDDQKTLTTTKLAKMFGINQAKMYRELRFDGIEKERERLILKKYNSEKAQRSTIKTRCNGSEENLNHLFDMTQKELEEIENNYLIKRGVKMSDKCVPDKIYAILKGHNHSLDTLSSDRSYGLRIFKSKQKVEDFLKIMQPKTIQSTLTIQTKTMIHCF